MKHSSTLIKLLVVFTLVSYSCKENKEDNSKRDHNKKHISVFNYEKKDQLSEYNKLNLEDSYPNLLNPKISKSKYSYKDNDKKIKNKKIY